MKPREDIHGWGSLSFKLGIFALCPVLLVK
jgi:hypothetical protein